MRACVWLLVRCIKAWRVLSSDTLCRLHPHRNQIVLASVCALHCHSSHAGLYEGGFKVWECSRDLVAFLHETEGDALPKAPLRVLELGCGHGLPAIHVARNHVRQGGEKEKKRRRLPSFLPFCR